MPSTEEPKGPPAPPGESAPAPSEPPQQPAVSYTQTTDNSYGYEEDPYTYGESTVTAPATESSEPSTAVATVSTPPEPPPPPSPPAPPEEEDQEENGMLRMSFLEHLEELRSRILRALMGVGIAYVACLAFAQKLWDLVIQPFEAALKSVGVQNPELIMIKPMEAFNVLWLKLPILAAVFLASPWVLYQVWSFIAPGLYKRERRLAAPFIVISAGLFIVGGLFAYFVAFRYGLAFLLTVGMDRGIKSTIAVSEYFDLFMNMTLGVGLVFELPVLIFLLTLVRVVTPGFLIRNSRYAVLIIVIVAAIITPTPDIFNLMLFSVPMVILFYAGVFASYILVLRREGRRFPWAKVLKWVGIVAFALGGLVYFAITKYGFHWVAKWPFLVR